jgi:2-hydroxychromene-2-carboxylate isomerase
MKPPIVLWFDFASPYAYVALDASERLAARHQREIEWRPILVWALLKAQSIPAPMDPPARRAYFVPDMARSAAFHGVPYRHPAKFPLSTHRAARLYYALAEHDRDRARALGRDLFSAYFADGVDISEPAALTELAARHGMDAQATAAAIEGETGRARLAAAIEQAVATGVCGSPWFDVDGEAFFGADRLPQIAWRLDGQALARSSEGRDGRVF